MMKCTLKVIVSLLWAAMISPVAMAQELYFPPLTGDSWEAMSIQEAGLCQEGVDSLYAYLDNVDSKAFMLLMDGKIVLEKYFGDFQSDSLWYWASAGKTLTAFAIGKAQEEGYLDIGEPSNAYLGQGWSALAPDQEGNISIWNHLTMTTGLDDGVPESDCTLDTCLVYLAEPGTRWAYHNAPYTLLDQVISSATGRNLNLYLQSVLKSQTGMDGLFIKLGYNNVFFSTPRSMARYGLLILNKGVWNGTTVLGDTAYFNAMVNTSQQLNPSYGFLWWLNGKSSFMLPGLQLTFDGPICPSAPEDMIAALGYNGQILNVVPSRNLVMLRMGTATSNAAIAATMNREIWDHLNEAFCTVSSTSEISTSDIRTYPNPASTSLTIDIELATNKIYMADLAGRVWMLTALNNEVYVSVLPAGVYILRAESHDGYVVRKVIVH